jgi:hypothetical protein
MKLTEILTESPQLTERTKPKTSNALGSMVDQLTGKNKSSTGGTTTPTPSGVKHTASPDNPNAQAPAAAAPAAAPAPAPNFGQGNYGQTTVNAPTGLTPQQNLPAAQPSAPSQAAAQEPPPESPAAQEQPPAQAPQAVEPQQAAQPAQQAAEPTQDKKPSLMQRIGQGAGEFMYGYRGGAGAPPPGQQDAAAQTRSAQPGSDQPTGADAPAAANQPAATGSAYMQLRSKVDQLDKKGKQRILAALQKDLGITPAAPAATADTDAGGQALDLDQFKQQQDQQRAAGVADQQQAMQQMQTTADANAAAAAERTNIEKAGRAAAAVPKFQRTASDKLAIKQAQDQGIKVETRKNKKAKKSLKESKNFSLPFSLFRK